MLITLGNHVNERTVNLNNCGVNKEVTIELDGVTYTTVTSDESGFAIAKLYDDGTYTIKTPQYTQSKNIVVDDDTEIYDVFFRFDVFISGRGFCYGDGTWSGSGDLGKNVSASSFGCGGSAIWAQTGTITYNTAIDITPYTYAHVDMSANCSVVSGGASCTVYLGDSVGYIGSNSRSTIVTNISSRTGLAKPSIYVYKSEAPGHDWPRGGSGYCYNFWLD